jgi:hypothetical protein
LQKTQARVPCERARFFNNRSGFAQVPHVLARQAARRRSHIHRKRQTNPKAQRKYRFFEAEHRLFLSKGVSKVFKASFRGLTMLPAGHYLMWVN